MTQTILDLEPFNRHTAFTLWKLCAHDNPAKKPYKTRVHERGSPNHSNANPARLLTADEARRAVAAVHAAGTGHDRMGEANYVGVGFVPGGTGLACLDIDNCLTGDPRAWSDTAQGMFKLFPGALVEVSQSGKGAHVWFSYACEVPGDFGKDVKHELELYTEKQFIAAGEVHPWGLSASVDHTEAMRALVKDRWPGIERGKRVAQGVEWVNEPDKPGVLRDLRSALERIAAHDIDDRRKWVAVCAALATIGEEARELWHDYSELDRDGRYDYDETEKVWLSFLNPDRTHWSSIFIQLTQGQESSQPQFDTKSRRVYSRRHRRSEVRTHWRMWVGEFWMARASRKKVKG
ncbi:MAG: hypothetical protein EON54_17395 [Alcaligenaceae bacterium]|nr:MAG: hypothetical protein EON54_17395 [Alcaligenaceae bacterium]